MSTIFLDIILIIQDVLKLPKLFLKISSSNFFYQKVVCNDQQLLKQNNFFFHSTDNRVLKLNSTD